jgi:hypothetical protein
MVVLFPQPIWFLIIDDTFIYRCSKIAPGSTIHHQHGRKTNRPQYALGQCWVSLALSISSGMKHSALPILSRLMRVSGNTTKLDAAKALLRVIAPVFAKKRVITLVDSWFMKWPYLKYVLDLGFNAIGQVRRDTVLFGLPAIARKRGRPRKYGDKFTADVVSFLPEFREEIFLYGKWQIVRYRTAICLARFLKGRKVRAVWAQFESADGKLSKQRLLISTDSTIMAQQIFVYYGRRWSIEDLFNQLKNKWGWKDAWQQSRTVLHRWTQIIFIAFALPQLLSTYCEDQLQEMLELTPWRKKNDITAGRVRLGLGYLLSNVRVREWWNPKCRIFKPPINQQVPSSPKDVTRNKCFGISKSNIAVNKPPPT